MPPGVWWISGRRRRSLDVGRSGRCLTVLPKTVGPSVEPALAVSYSYSARRAVLVLDPHRLQHYIRSRQPSARVRVRVRVPPSRHQRRRQPSAFVNESPGPRGRDRDRDRRGLRLDPDTDSDPDGDFIRAAPGHSPHLSATDNPRMEFPNIDAAYSGNSVCGVGFGGQVGDGIR
jgi:hypothetical protein